MLKSVAGRRVDKIEDTTLEENLSSK